MKTEKIWYIFSVYIIQKIALQFLQTNKEADFKILKTKTMLLMSAFVFFYSEYIC